MQVQDAMAAKRKARGLQKASPSIRDSASDGDDADSDDHDDFGASASDAEECTSGAEEVPDSDRMQPEVLRA